MAGQAKRYQRLRHEDTDSQPANSKTGDADTMTARVSLDKELRRAKGLSALNIVLLFALLCSLGLSFWAKSSPPSQSECAPVVSPHSPLLRDLQFWQGDIHYPRLERSKYVGPPTLEREQAWHDLWHHPTIGLQKSDLDKLNKTEHERYVQVVGSTPEKPLYGGLLEVFHQLHCLNKIRIATWPIDRFSKSWGDLYPDGDDVSRRLHADHCIETLRLILMCYSDVTPLLSKNDDEEPLGFTADFDVPHKCRDFDKLSSLVDAEGSSATTRAARPHLKTAEST